MVNNLNIGTKLNLNILLVAIGLLILGLSVYTSILEIKKEYKVSNQISTQTNGLKSMLIGGLLYNSASSVVHRNSTQMKAKNTMKKGYESVEKISKRCKKFAPEIHNVLKNELSDFLQMAKSMHQKAINNQKFTSGDIKNSLAKWRALKFKIQPQIEKLEKELKSSEKKYEELISNTIKQFFITIIIILVVAISISYFIAKSIKEPIALLTEAVKALMDYSSADQEIDIRSNDEIGQLSKYFNQYMHNQREKLKQEQHVVEEVDKAIQMVRAGFFVYKVKSQTDDRSTNDLKNSVNAMIDDLGKKFDIIDNALIEYGNAKFDHKFDVDNVSGTIGSIVYGTKAIGSNISEFLATIMISGEQLSHNIKILSTSANSLSTSANAQAASLEETAAAVEEISSNIQSSSENVTKMSKLSDEVTQSAVKGERLASQTASSMDEINGQVTSINEAITVIDQIAFQTNILSLNAAVEAATAGEAGKGFAVVAQEVRNLAARSAEAANEIKSLVETAATKANSGKQIADEMIHGYNELNEKIAQNKDMIDLVSQASTEQTKGIVQINDAINVLDKNTQENANDATNISTLAQEISKLSDNLMSFANHAHYRDEAKTQVCDVDMIYNLNKLKLEHLNFKTTNFARLDERSSFKVATHTECNLAKWIKEQESAGHEFTKSQNWKELNEAHALVHQNVQKYIDRNAQNDSNEHLLQIGNEIEEATGRVFIALNVVKRENCDFNKK